MVKTNQDSLLNTQQSDLIQDAEDNSKIGVIESILSGVASGLIGIPKGIFSLGASLMDLGVDKNRAARVEQWFDDLTEFDEKAQAHTAGKITELLVNIGVPGTIGFKIGTKLATKAMSTKRAGNYFRMGDKGGKTLSKTAKKAFQLNDRGRATRFIAGAVSGGISEGIFIGDVQDAGTFGDLLGGPTKINREDPHDPARAIINRIKFGTEGALFTGLVGGIGKTLRALAKRKNALEESDSTIDKAVDWIGSSFTAAGSKGTKFFRGERGAIGLKRADIKAAQRISRQLNMEIDGMFPYLKRTFDQSTKAQKTEFKKLLNDALIFGKAGLKKGISHKQLIPKYSRVLDKATGKMKPKVNFGSIDPLFKKRIAQFMKARNNNMKIDNDKLANIFASLDLMRFQWGKMFSQLGETIDPKAAQKILRSGSLKQFKDLFGKKFTNYLSSTYDIFQNQPLLPLWNYTPSREALDAFIKALRESGGGRITYEEAEALARRILKPENVKKPGRFDQDVKIGLPTFFTSKTLASVKKLPLYKQQKFREVELGTGQLTPKKEQAIKNLLGKTEDPLDTILGSTEKISQVTRGNQFINRLVIESQEALKKGSRALLYTDEDQLLKEVQRLRTKGTPINLNNYRQITISKNQQAGLWHQADGKWAKKSVADAIEDAAGNNLNVPKKGIVNNALYQNLILIPKATAQIAKTILSPVTHMRNLVSAGAFAAANGIIPLIHFNPKMMLKTYKMLDVGLPGARQQQEAYEELVRLGVVNTNVSLGDLRGLLKDINFGSAFESRAAFKGMTNRLSKIKKWTEDMYTAEDDFWKIGTYAVEQGRLGRAFTRAGVKEGDLVKNHAGEMVEYGEQFLKEEAASIVRNNVPNYDYVSEFVKGLRRWPIGNFMAFPSEIMRTSTNIIKRALDEIAYTVNGKKPLAAIGMQRLLGMGLTTAAVPYGVVKLGQAVYDISDEQLAAIRRYVAPWAKNSTIIPLRKEDGEFQYVDFSNANAYDLLVRPIQTVINAVAAGEKDNNGIMDDFVKGTLLSFGSIMEPFVTEAIWTEAVMDVIPILGRGGQTIEGVKVYNPQSDYGTIAKKIFLHLGKAQAPFSWQQLERLDYAVGPFDSIQLLRGKPGKFDPRGQTYELGDELLGFLGARPVTIDLERSLQFKISKYLNNKREAGQLFTTQTLKGGPIDPEEIVDAFLNANRATYSVQKDMFNDIDGAKTLEISPLVLDNTFKQRMSRKEFRTLDGGFFKPYEISRDIQNKFFDIAQKLGIPNPYLGAMGVITAIENSLIGLRLLPGTAFPDIMNPFKVKPISTLPKVEPNISTTQNVPPVDANLISSTNMGQGVNQMTGLTANQEALLSPSDKLIARKQNQKSGIMGIV